MTTPVPSNPKIYHIVHADRLPSIIRDGYLWSDGENQRRNSEGTTIGMGTIKARRLHQLTLSKWPDLHVGDCVPFYFAPRSVMLYMLHMGNHAELTYHGGQEPIIHLEADLRQTAAWAAAQGLRWAFTLSNAGSSYFEDRYDLAQFGDIKWDAVSATDWQECKEEKQAEFLIERQFPWGIVSRIGVNSAKIQNIVLEVLDSLEQKPPVEIHPEWYY
jgi:hypothetical protein